MTAGKPPRRHNPNSGRSNPKCFRKPTLPGEPRAKQVLARQNKFLQAFSAAGTIQGAARAAKINRETVRQWRHNDAAFEELFQNADSDVTGLLEDSAMTDALGHWDPKKKRNVGACTITRIFLLKSRDPEKYRDNLKVEHAGEPPVRFTLNLGDAHPIDAHPIDEAKP